MGGIGGFDEDMFLDLSEDERQEIMCCICFGILNETAQCENGHKSCTTCLNTWLDDPWGEDEASCPMCRCVGIYTSDVEMDERIQKKMVRCPRTPCGWTGQLCHLNPHQLKAHFASAQVPKKRNKLSSVVTRALQTFSNGIVFGDQFITIRLIASALTSLTIFSEIAGQVERMIRVPTRNDNRRQPVLPVNMSPLGATHNLILDGHRHIIFYGLHVARDGMLGLIGSLLGLGH